MNVIFDQNTIVIIVAIENYRFDNISRVRYALNDARAFKTALTSHFNIPESNIKTLYDSNASKTALENDIHYEIRNLSSDNKFIFYYAGHGFHDGTTNKISAYDTNSHNLSGTTLSLRTTLIDPLNDSECTKSLIFIDSCSKYFSENIASRDPLSNILDSEFRQLTQNSEFTATFLSCSPGEKSYSDDNLNHGIWTFHLLRALSGKEPSAARNNRYITDSSLRDYLRISVSEYIINDTDIDRPQTPTANINATNTFLIREIPQEEQTQENHTEGFPNLNLSLEGNYIYKINYQKVKKARGFKAGHFLPSSFSPASSNFIKSVFSEEISEEIQMIYQNSRDVLGYRRREMEKILETGRGSLKTPIFEYDLLISQSSKDAADGEIKRKITLLENQESLSIKIDEIFPFKFTSIKLACNITEDSYDTTVELFENLAEEENGRIEDDDRVRVLKYYTTDGLVFRLDFRKQEAILFTKREFPLIKYIEKAESFLEKISNSTITIIGASTQESVTTAEIIEAIAPQSDS